MNVQKYHKKDVVYFAGADDNNGNVFNDFHKFICRNCKDQLGFKCNGNS